MDVVRIGVGDLTTNARPATNRPGVRWIPFALAATLVLSGLAMLAIRLDAPDDGSLVSAWSTMGVRVDMAAAAGSRGLATGDLIRGIGGVDLTDGLGNLARPTPGQALDYQVARNGATRSVSVVVGPTQLTPLLVQGWGNLVFVCSLAALAAALRLRRPQEPTTVPLLIASACLLGSTVAFTVGTPAVATATGGPELWVYLLDTGVVYSFAWGAVLVFTLQLSGLLRPRRPRALVLAYVAGPGLFFVWIGISALFASNPCDWIGRSLGGQTTLVALTLMTTTVLGVAGYVRSADPVTKDRLRWIAIGGVASAVIGLAGWHVPNLVLGHPLLPSGAIGLSALPFVAGIAVALQRHHLFDIERLANRSLVNVTLIALLAGGYAVVVAILVSGLGLSGSLAAALAAAAVALTLAPLHRLTKRGINRLMYGDRDDPGALLARLGTRMQAAMLPDDVPPAVVETVARSLRLPYVAVDIADGAGRFSVAAEHGTPKGAVHDQILTHRGTTVGRLRVSDRGSEDPLEQTDLDLIRSLAREVGPAVEAVRLHRDLLQSRAEAVALREDERRRLRRDLHDGLGPTLAAIGLKAALAARDVPAASTAHALLGEIENEATTSLGDIRRLVEALRPPALDELGLLGALRSRASSLTGDVAIEVSGHLAGPLPAATETAAYRIAVEAMTNAVRHSSGTACTVMVATDAGELLVTARDNGHGLDASRVPGVGLRSMQERAEEVGGSLRLDSTSGGTVVSARLPLDLGGIG